MASPSSTTCPSCGSDDRVHGRPGPHTGDVELTCTRCEASWWRGRRGCATCGGQDLTTRPQVMRRHSRGTQLSIMGWRDAVLCHTCDAGVIASVGTTDTPIAEEYVSAAIVDRHAPTATPQRQTAGTVRWAPPPPAPRDARPVDQAAAGTPRPVPTVPPPPAPPTTVRQALQRSQEQLTDQGTRLDPTVVLLLGTRLGSTTRLDALERSGHDPAAVATWVRSTWGSADRSGDARHTLITLADHWLASGWTTTDLAAALRSQERP